VVISEEEK
jgi:hypothetical protein